MITGKRRRLRSGPGPLGDFIYTETDAKTGARPKRHAWDQPAVGPFKDPRDEKKKEAFAAAVGPIDHDSSGVIDMRGRSDWALVFTKDSSPFHEGRIDIDSSAVASAAQTTVDATNHLEVRVIEVIAGLSEIVLEQAIANHDDADDAFGTGPIVLSYGVGEVPDRIEVWARARQGGVAETAINADETLTINCSTRFRR